MGQYVIDWDAVKMYGGYVLWALTLIVGALLTLRRERRDTAKAKREESSELRQDVNSRRTGSALWRPTELEIERIVRETQAFQQRHPPRSKVEKKRIDELYRQLFATLDLVNAFIGRAIEFMTIVNPDGTRDISPEGQAALKKDFPGVFEKLVRSTLAVVERQTSIQREASIEADESKRAALQAVIEMNQKLLEALGSMEIVLYEAAAIPSDERQLERERMERTVRGQ